MHWTREYYKYFKQIPRGLKGKIDKNAITVGAIIPYFAKR